MAQEATALFYASFLRQNGGLTCAKIGIYKDRKRSCWLQGQQRGSKRRNNEDFHFARHCEEPSLLLVIARSQNYFHCDAAICLSGCVCMRLLLRNNHFLSASFFHAPRNGYYNRLSIFKGNKAFFISP